MKINKQMLAAIIVSSVTLVSCGGGVKSSSSSLAGTNWQLYSLNGNVIGQKLSKRVTLNFDKKRASGSAGCNRYFSSYQVSEVNGLYFNNIGSTKKLCFKRRFMKVERNFLNALSNASSYQMVSNNELSINGSGGLLKFTRP